MPQVTNLRLIRDKNNSPIGKGTLHNALLNISASTRERAVKLNVVENDRLKRIISMCDKNKRRSDYVSSVVLQKAQRSLQELNAYKDVLNNDYSVSQFKTMDPRFTRQCAQTPRTVRRYNLETRIYHTGYGIQPFRPEINRRIHQTDPARITKIYKKVLLEKFKNESDLVIDRKLSTSSFFRMLEDKNNFKDYTYQRLNSPERSDEQYSQADPTERTTDSG
ncbi:hypothetical protein KP79_PYT21151 [Mizuhopecten yessoensis]|uniref:Uncharacterized protein n=1 Tax=Mizuhopecten yessoensis TaxID=6573 RepID=A0A210Q5T0_MIZYE|nr:hypothetical protein KP79_PYT21151 [Mizuhopecten yessoensis]